MPTIAHFVITRFNLRRSATESGPQLDPQWLAMRFDLFDRFCFPTVRRQTNPHFRWLVLFDSDTPPSIRDRVAAYQEWPAFTPVFFAPGSREQARSAVIRHLTTLPNLLVTTRLDNDDALCRTFVEDVQRCAMVAAPTVLEFPVGFVWHRNRIYLDHQPANPFATLVEPLAPGATNIHTVYAASHHDVSRLGRVRQVSNRPSWMQVIHGDNRENRVRGVRQSLRALADRFDINTNDLIEAERPLAVTIDRARTRLTYTAAAAWNLARRRLRP